MSETAKRKLTRKEKREIEAAIRKAKGDGKPHIAQDSIPFEVMYPDGLCKVHDKSWSKCIEFEDVNYQLANVDEKTAVFENLCDFYNYYDASIGIQLSFIRRYANKEDFRGATAQTLKPGATGTAHRLAGGAVCRWVGGGVRAKGRPYPGWGALHQLLG